MEDKSMIYVTGITGHSGNWFLKRLKQEKFAEKIRCVVRSGSDTEKIDHSDLETEKVVGSLDDSDFLDRTMAGSRAVVHIAGIRFSENVVKAARKNGVDWAILVHTTGMYSRFKSAAAQYLEIENLVAAMRSETFGITILRPTMIYGSPSDCNMYKLVGYLDRHLIFPVFGKGVNLMQPVHAKDLGNAYYDVLVNKDRTFGSSYNLSGGKPIRYIDLCREISMNLKKKNLYIKVPFGISLALARIYNRFFKNAVISEEQVLRMKEDKVFDHSGARRDFGYDPVSFQVGIISEVREYLDRKGRPTSA